MSSISNSSISIESEALAAPVIHAGFHRENPRLTDNHESDIPGSIPGRSSKIKMTKRTDSLVVRTSDFSMSMRVLKGISQTKVLFSGYFDRALGGIAQLVERMSIKRGVPGSNPGPSANEQRYENGISACLRTSGNPINSRFGLRGGSKPPLCTKEAA